MIIDPSSWPSTILPFPWAISVGGTQHIAWAPEGKATAFPFSSAPDVGLNECSANSLGEFERSVWLP